MKNSKIVTIIILICLSILCTACVKASPTDNVIETGKLYELDDLSYEIKRMHSGKLLFSIKGKWDSNYYWSYDIRLKDDIFIHEDFVGEDLVVYFIENISSEAGYTEITLSLKEKETDILQGECVLLVLADSNRNINVEQIWYREETEK